MRAFTYHQDRIIEKGKEMTKNASIKLASVPCMLALMFVSLACCPVPAVAQTDWGVQPAKPAARPPAYTPPPDQMIYFRTGHKEKAIGVTATNFNVPGLPVNLNYFRQTDELIEDLGYDIPDNPAHAPVQVRVTVKYTQVDNSQAAVNEVGGKTAAGAVLGALTGLVVGGGRGAAEGAAGGAAVGLTAGSTTPPVLKYLTLEFEVSSRTGGRQVGQITKDITDPPNMGMEEFIDAVVADYLEAALPKKR
jgi:hypothetical protein